jgi:NIPSNAP
MRIYRAVPASLPAFRQFFQERLLPVQPRYGARLIGRWETEDDRVVAIWEYDDRESYEQIQAAVSRDPDSRRAQEYRRAHLPELFTSMEELFMNAASLPACGTAIVGTTAAAAAMSAAGVAAR